MSSLASEILARFAPEIGAVEPPLLRGLLQRALEGEGEVLRLSERRLVLKLDATADLGPFLLKLDAPQRRLEGLRRMLRTPPAEREAQAWIALDAAGKRGDWAGLPFPIEQMAYCQLDAARGCFCRPFVSGSHGSAFRPEDLAAAGLGLARLHQAGWTDADLSPGDLLLNKNFVLLPLDLGHAKVEDAPTTVDDRRRDLIHILGGWSVSQRRLLAQDFLRAYAEAGPLPDAAERLIDLALLWRQEILKRQAHRCLRRTSDFEEVEHGMLRTSGVARAASVVLELDSVERARKAWRQLYELELHGVPSLQIARLEHTTVYAAVPQHGMREPEEVLDFFRVSGMAQDTEEPWGRVMPHPDGGFYLHPEPSAWA
ncbi:MAG: hypothetical protein ACPG31_10315 [Planctomycetota bacterium]